MMTYTDRPWLKHLDPRINKNTQITEIPVHHFLTNSSRKFPDFTALYFYGAEYSYAELESLTNKLAGSLQQLGLAKGDRVAIFMDNCPQYVIAFFGILKAGGVVVQASPMAAERELAYLVQDSGACGIITLDYLWPKARALSENGVLKFAAVGSLYDTLPNQPFPVKPFAIPERPLPVDPMPGVYTFNSLLNSKRTFTPPDMDIQNDLAVLQYTSGTTGFPKGVMVSHYNLSAYISILSAMDYKSVPGEEVYPVTLPMSHNYAMFQTVVAPLAIGGKVVIMVRFHPDEVLKVIDALHPTIFRAVPTMLAMMIGHPLIKSFNLRSVRHWIVGGAPVPDELVAKFKEVSGANVVEGYGLTESTSGVVLNSLYDKTFPGMGFPLLMMDARVIDSVTGQDVPFGQDGELLLKGPTISSGYWKKPEDTAQTFKDGWLHTGDIVRMSDEGVLQFVDRLKEMIIVSGFNVYPTEVENALYEYPGVLEAAVIGWPDERQGEIVKAVLVPKPGMTLDDQAVIAFCRERLSAYKVPKIIEVTDSLPKNPTGKIQKKALKKK